MPNRRKPLLIQSGRHPFELVILFMCVLTGLAGLLTGSASPAIVIILHEWSWIWNVSIVLGGIGTGLSVLCKLPVNLLLERVGMVWLFTLFAAYSAAIFSVDSDRAVTSGGIVLALALAALARVLQITKDLSKLQKALAEPHPTEDSMLADPHKNNTGGAHSGH